MFLAASWVGWTECLQNSLNSKMWIDSPNRFGQVNRFSHQGIPAPVTSHWIGLDYLAETRGEFKCTLQLHVRVFLSHEPITSNRTVGNGRRWHNETRLLCKKLLLRSPFVKFRIRFLARYKTYVPKFSATYVRCPILRCVLSSINSNTCYLHSGSK